MDTLRESLVSLLNRVPAPFAARLGASTSAARVLRPLVDRFLPRAHVVAVVRAGPARGIKLLIEPRGEKFYWTGQHERAVQDALTSLLRPGDVFWDVGAHVGLYALLGARAVGTGGKVHAFEPMPANRARLEESIRLNECTNVRIHPHALAAEPGTARLHGARATATWSLLPTGEAAEHVFVECRTLDGLAKELELPQVLKIDAEGVEIDVLRGGADLLARGRPTVILELVEEEQVEEARALLPDHGFRRLDPHHWLIVPGERPSAETGRSTSAPVGWAPPSGPASTHRRTWWQRRAKRTIDVSGSLLALVLLSPVLLGIGLAILLVDGRPVLYPWRVLGEGGRPFTGYKFRTMVREADEIRTVLADANEMRGPVFKIRGDPRVTRLGRFLRRYSLDELPQLWSVLVGDMSLVGPRPVYPLEYAAFSAPQRRKLSVKPGMTCLWQVSGRNEINDFEEWIRLDLQYIDEWSLRLDLAILLKTLPAVLSGRGAW